MVISSTDTRDGAKDPWAKFVDLDTGARFWYNRSTSVHSWIHPVTGERGDANIVVAGYKIVLDRVSCQFKCFNQTTGVVFSETPGGLDIPALATDALWGTALALSQLVEVSSSYWHIYKTSKFASKYLYHNKKTGSTTGHPPPDVVPAIRSVQSLKIWEMRRQKASVSNVDEADSPVSRYLLPFFAEGAASIDKYEFWFNRISGDYSWTNLAVGVISSSDEKYATTLLCEAAAWGLRCENGVAVEIGLSSWKVQDKTLFRLGK